MGDTVVESTSEPPPVEVKKLDAETDTKPRKRKSPGTKPRQKSSKKEAKGGGKLKKDDKSDGKGKKDEKGESKGKKRSVSGKTASKTSKAKGKKKAENKGGNENSDGPKKKKQRVRGKKGDGDDDTIDTDGKTQQGAVRRRVPSCVQVDNEVRTWQCNAHWVAEQPLHVLLDICAEVFNAENSTSEGIQWEKVAEALQKRRSNISTASSNVQGGTESYLTSHKVSYPMQSRRGKKLVTTTTPPAMDSDRLPCVDVENRAGEFGGKKQDPFSADELKNAWKFIAIGLGEIPHSDGKCVTWNVPDPRLNRVENFGNPFSEWFGNTGISGKGKASSKPWRKSTKQRTREVEYRAKKMKSKKEEEDFLRPKPAAVLQVDNSANRILAQQQRNNGIDTGMNNGYNTLLAAQQQLFTHPNGMVNMAGMPMMPPEMMLQQQQWMTTMMQQQQGNSSGSINDGNQQLQSNQLMNQTGLVNGIPTTSIAMSHQQMPMMLPSQVPEKIDLGEAMHGFALWVYEEKREFLENVISEIQKPVEAIRATNPEVAAQAEAMAEAQAMAVENNLTREFLSLDPVIKNKYIERAKVPDNSKPAEQESNKESVENNGQTAVAMNGEAKGGNNNKPGETGVVVQASPHNTPVAVAPVAVIETEASKQPGTVAPEVSGASNPDKPESKLVSSAPISDTPSSEIPSSSCNNATEETQTKATGNCSTHNQVDVGTTPITLIPSQDSTRNMPTSNSDPTSTLNSAQPRTGTDGQRISGEIVENSAAKPLHDESSATPVADNKQLAAVTSVVS